MAHLIAAGALIRDGRILLGHRRADRRSFPDCWDLPGGHVEVGERPVDALVRELREEVGVEAVVAGGPSLRVAHEPELDDGMVMDVWSVTTWEGEPTNRAPQEHDELRWVTVHDLPRLDLAHPAYPAFFVELLRAGRERERCTSAVRTSSQRLEPRADGGPSAL